MTNWDLSTGQAGINDMCRGFGQARPCMEHSLMHDGGPAGGG